MDIDILNFVKKNYPKYSSLLWGIAFIVSFLAVSEQLLKSFIDNNTIRLTIYLLMLLIWFLKWLKDRNNWPRNKNDLIGIVICIKTENDKQKIRLKNDFIQRLNELINQNNLLAIINVIHLNEFQSEKAFDVLVLHTKRLDELLLGIDNKNYSIDKKWIKLKKKLNSQFYIWGDIKERLDLEPKYFLDLNARVIHQPISLKIKNPVQEAFKYTWHKKITFGKNIELKGFMVTADLVFLAVKYVVGVAALISQDPFTALKLHESLGSDLKKFNPLPPNLVGVKKDLLKHLSDECVIIARHYQITNDENNSKTYLRRSIDYDPENSDSYLLKSLHDFVYDNDPEEAIRSCHKAKKCAKNNGTWRYNLGFLLMYLEQFDKALEVYYEIENNSYDGEEFSLSQVYNFNLSFIENNPDKIQSYFILGFLKLKKDGNYPESLELFTMFIKSAKDQKKYERLIELSNNYLKDIKKNMGLS